MHKPWPDIASGAGQLSIYVPREYIKGRNVMKSKWVFIKKCHADRSLDRYRASYNVEGLTHNYCIDYNETLS